MLPTPSGSTPAPQVFMSAKRNCSKHRLAWASVPPRPSNPGSPAVQDSSHSDLSCSPSPSRNSSTGRSRPLSADDRGTKCGCVAGEGAPAGDGVDIRIGARAGDGTAAGGGVGVSVRVEAGNGAGVGVPAARGIGVGVRVEGGNGVGVRVVFLTAGGVRVGVAAAGRDRGGAGTGGEMSSAASTKGESPSESRISSTSSSEITTGSEGVSERDGKGIGRGVGLAGEGWPTLPALATEAEAEAVAAGLSPASSSESEVTIRFRRLIFQGIFGRRFDRGMNLGRKGSGFFPPKSGRERWKRGVQEHHDWVFPSKVWNGRKGSVCVSDKWAGDLLKYCALQWTGDCRFGLSLGSSLFDLGSRCSNYSSKLLSVPSMRTSMKSTSKFIY
jgi:hypothetical protein